MSSRVWKFFSDTIGKLQSPRTLQQQNENAAESSSLRQTDSLSDTPTRHGSSNKAGEQLVDNALSSVQDESILDTPLNKKSNNIREQLKEAVKSTTRNEPEEVVPENVTAINTDNYESTKASKPAKRAPRFLIPPPRHGPNKGSGLSEAAEPLAHIEPPVEAPSNIRKSRGRGRPPKAKPVEPVVYDEAPVYSPHGENIGEVAEPLVNNEPLVDHSLNGHKTRTRSRAVKTVVHNEAPSSIPHRESRGLKREHITEVAESSVQGENPVDIPQINHTNKTRRILPKVEEPDHTPEPFLNTLPIGNNKRRRDILETSNGNEVAEINSPANTPNKRQRIAPKTEGMGIPPVGTTQEARDARRKYMDRERQRRCRQRKKEKQQGEQAAERVVVAQAKDDRKKAMARERVRRHRENQKQKQEQGSDTETKMGDKQRLREEVRKRDRELIASGGRTGAGTQSFNTE
ncbi:hypothetical protein NHQ30_004408 [Ciborinia camelliae]|nr:hypothetical protein NHQ30_004408 [Ciborinia camelliae]